MKSSLFFLVSAVFGGVTCFAGAALLPRTAPVTTVRFPGGNYGSVTESNGLVVTSSGWSREDTAGVFDFSDPAKPKFLARFPAKGYSCAAPVFFGSRCYVPNGFCATVIDLSDRKHPRFAGYLNPRFPQDGCKRLWVEDGQLYFLAFDGCYRVKEDGLSFEKTDRTAPKPAPRKPAEPGAVKLKGSAVCFGETEVPYVHDLATLAVRDGKVYVYASCCGGAHLLPLEVKEGGLKLFGPRHQVADLPRGRGYHTMGMQTAICATRVGDLLFADDGIVRLGRKGNFETLLERTRSASNSSVDGTRIALAQCSRCRVIDFTDPNDVKILDVTPKTELPIHITGCNLRGNDLYLAYTLVEFKGQDYIYRFPTKGYVVHVDLRRPAESSPAVEIPICIALDCVGDWLYVTCRRGDFAIIDVRNPEKIALAGVRRDILDGDGFKVKTFGGRTFVLNGHRVVELDVSEPSAPRVKHLYDRGDGADAPGYDDFTVDGGKLYALAHASLDVFELDDVKRTTEVPNDCGLNGVLKEPLKEVDAAIFAGHVTNPRLPEGVSFQAGRFGNSFGAFVFDWVKLPDGRYAVAYGEAGVVLCDEKGAFAAELPRSTNGWTALFAAEVLCKGGKIFVKDGEGKAFEVDLH